MHVRVRVYQDIGALIVRINVVAIIHVLTVIKIQENVMDVFPVIITRIVTHLVQKTVKYQI